MALNGTVLGDLMRAAVDAAVASTPAAGTAQRQAVFRALGDAIVAHITSAATVTVTVASVSGVTVGAGVSGPGAGTGTIT
jgi:hypothetical protein